MASNIAYVFVGLLMILFLYYLMNIIISQEGACRDILIERKSKTKYNEYLSFQDQLDNKYFSGNIIINGERIEYNYKLKDFYIKTAYNCCCNGTFKNDYVDLCALENCASYGVRGLHFQLYSIDSEPVVAASSTKSNFMKETYNYIKFDKTMEHVRKYFLSNETNKIDYANTEVLKDDPLFLFFTIHYSQIRNFPGNNADERKETFYNKIYSVLVDIFGKSKFNSFIIGNIFTGFDKHELIGMIPMKDTQNRIFIFIEINGIDNISPFKKSKLYTITDDVLSTGDALFSAQSYRFGDLKDNASVFILRDNNKNKLSACFPDRSIYNDNYDFLIPMTLGIQFCGMNFQNQDGNLINYNNFFIDQYGSNNSNMINSPYIKKPDKMISFPSTLNRYFE